MVSKIHFPFRKKKYKDMKKKSSLSEEIMEGKMHQFDHAEIILTKNVKEKIQNVQRRVKKKFSAPDYYKWKDILQEIDKIFLEELGEKLI